jgi:hypothetical protein
MTMYICAYSLVATHVLVLDDEGAGLRELLQLVVGWLACSVVTPLLGWSMFLSLLLSSFLYLSLSLSLSLSMLG